MGQVERGPEQIALFVNPMGQRRVDFQRLCGEQFGRLFLADGAEQASEMLAAQPVDLLVIDLERFERGHDLAAIGELVAGRKGRGTLVLCPYTQGGWLAPLMEFGPLAYAITPLVDAELLAVLAAQLQGGAAGAAGVEQLRGQLAAMARLQDAIDVPDDVDQVAAGICAAMCVLPGVAQAALLLSQEGGELRVAAQHSPRGIDLHSILAATGRLQQSPLGHVFPGVVAAGSGEMALLDAPAKAGEPELAVALLDAGIEMVLGLPLPGDAPGTAGGALCLMFTQARPFAGDEVAAFARLAQLAAFGLDRAELVRDNRQMAVRLTHLATTDALTCVANRRHGEYLLELEARRARRYKVPLALIGFDIDRFKAINDQFGHLVGDAVLRIVAEVTQAGLRNSDVLVRSGGEEFLVIAPHTSAIDALKMAEKIRLTIAEAAIPGCDRVTISLGVGQLSEQESADALACRVDAALARAKRAGRNCVELAMQ